MLGALFPPNGRYALLYLVALTPAPILLIRAKHLFVAAIDGWGFNLRQSADQNMTAGSVASEPVQFSRHQQSKAKQSKARDAGNAAAEGKG